MTAAMPKPLQLIYRECLLQWRACVDTVLKQNAFKDDAFQKHKVDIVVGLEDCCQKHFEAIMQPKAPSYSMGLIGQVQHNFKNLALVDKEALSLKLLSDKFTDRTLTNCQTSLAILNLRLEHISNQELELDDIPLNPASIAELFLELMMGLPLSAEQRPELFRTLLVELAKIHRSLIVQANNICIEQGVLADLNDADGLAQVKKSRAKLEAQKKRKTLIASICKDVKLDSKGQPLMPKMEQVLEHLAIPNEALGFVSTKEGNTALAGKDLVEHIEKSLPVSLNNQGYQEDFTVQSLSDFLAESGVFTNVAINAVEQNSMAMVSMLFEDLYHHNQFAKPMLYILEQMKLPFLKTAILDKNFFADSHNSAQALLDAIAEQASAWSKEKDPERDFLYKKMFAIVLELNQNFDGSYQKFSNLLQDFKAFLKKHQERSVRIEARLVSMEKAKARQQRAREQAQAHIEQRFSGVKLPEPVQKFLDSRWQGLLFFIHNLYDSKQNKAWKRSINAEQLWLSVLHGEADADPKKAVASMQQQLLNIGVEKSECNRDLKTILPYLKPLPKKANIPQQAETTPIAEAEPEQPTIEATAPSATPASPSPNPQTANELAQNLQQQLTVGTWLLTQENGQEVKVKVAAYIKHTDTYILVYRNGSKFDALNSLQIQERMNLKQLQLIESALLFDKALESVIVSLRD